MNPLLNNLTKFISTVLQLYAPLPFEMTADLHTLNAYLRSYSEKEESLLANFVNKLGQKLENKLKGIVKKQLQNNSCLGDQFQHTLHYNKSFSSKYPQLKLCMDSQKGQEQKISQNNSNLTYNFTISQQNAHILSQRAGKSQYDGIKSDRHKFGNKYKSKLPRDHSKEQDLDSSKQNRSIDFNIPNQKSDILKDGDKSLKFIKSQAEISLQSHCQSTMIRKKSTDVCIREKQKDISKPKVRYQSNDNKPSNNSSSLRIKLKSKPIIPTIVKVSTLELWKIRQDINEITELFQKQQDEVLSLYKISIQQHSEQQML